MTATLVLASSPVHPGVAAGSVVGRGPVPESALGAGAWVLAGFFALSTLGNLAGKHPVERFGAAGLTTVLAVLCGVVAALR